MINIEERKNINLKCISRQKDVMGKDLMDEIRVFKNILKNQGIYNSYKIFTVINAIKLIGFEQVMQVEILAIPDEQITDIQFEPVNGCGLIDKKFKKVLFAKYIGNSQGIQMFHQSIQQKVKMEGYKLISPPYNIFNDPNDLSSGNNKEFSMEMFFEIE